MAFIVVKALKLIHFDTYGARATSRLSMKRSAISPPVQRKKAAIMRVNAFVRCDNGMHLDWNKAMFIGRDLRQTASLKENGIQAKEVSRHNNAILKPRVVELDGRVVNDKTYTPEMYAV